MARAERLFGRPPVVLLLFVLLSVGLFKDAWSAPRTRWVGGLYDPEQVMWFLRWTPWAFAHGQNPLLTDHLNAPQGANLMWNTGVALAGVVLSPFSTTLGPVFAYNVLVTSGVALSGWCCWLLLRRLVGGTAAPLAGGVLYGFSPYVLSQAQAHGNLVFAAIPPLMALALDAMLRPRSPRERTRAAAGLGVLAAAQLLLSEELLAIEAIGVAILLLTLAVTHRRHLGARIRQLVTPFGIALGIFVVFAAFPIGVQFLGPNRIDGQIQPHGVHVADLANLVTPTQVEALSPQSAQDLTHRFTGNLAEDGAYLGIPLLIICAWTVVRRWRAVHVLLAVVVGAVALVFAMGESLHVGGNVTQIPLPWRAIEGLPLLTDMVTARFTMIVDLCAAVLLAEFVTSVATTPRAARAALIVEALTLLTLFPTTPFLATSREVPAFFDGSSALERIPENSVALVLPAPGSLDADAMLWQAVAGMRYRMPQGYIYAPPPPGQPPIEHPQNAIQSLVDATTADPSRVAPSAELAAARADLVRFDVRTVVVGPGAGHDTLVGMVRTLLGGRAPLTVAGVDVWYDAQAAGSLSPSG